MLFHAETRRSPREQADVSRRRILALLTPTALRPPAQGWPRNEDNPGFAPDAEANRIAVVATPRTPRTNDTNPPHATAPQAVAPGPEGRQTVAQRVSAGSRPP